MYDTLNDIQALLGSTEESISLDFKSGRFFDSIGNENVKRDLIHDATAFANAGGGTIIFGIAEKQVNGRSVADKLEPVAHGAITRDRLAQILSEGSDPPLRDFRIRMIPLAGNSADVIVLEIDEGHTAFQSRLDKRFYHRVEATTASMHGYAIRDVMNRRTTPRLDVELRYLRDTRNPAYHIYQIEPKLKNVGAITARLWALRLEIPAFRAEIAAQPSSPQIFSLGHQTVNGLRHTGFEFSSERSTRQFSLSIMPDDELVLGAPTGFSYIQITIDPNTWERVSDLAPPIRWTLFVDNARRRDGEDAFEHWCRF